MIRLAGMTMDMDFYQRRASETAKYPPNTALTYCVLGLASEAGEVAGKLKKAIRDENGTVSMSRKADLLAELGDVLWYCAMVALELDSTLSSVAEANLVKLFDRKDRNVIGGDGDKR